MSSLLAPLCVAFILCTGCGGDASERDRSKEQLRSKELAGTQAHGQSGSSPRCDATAPGREESAYDTSGDQKPDVRKVYLQVGDKTQRRLVLICRETDLNFDGVKDIVRHYDDEGRPLREEADRNFDGRMDAVTYFELGRVIRKEFDTNGSGVVDTKVFFEDGEALRGERDIAGRSTAAKWQPDRWEYYEEGRVIRVGSDLDGDGAVDRWDRNEDLVDQPPVTSLGEPLLGHAPGQ